jgi:hypothetical protein
MEQHRVEHEKRSRGGFDGRFELAGQAGRRELLDPMGAGQHHRRAVLAREPIDAEERADRDGPRGHEMLIGQIAVKRGLRVDVLRPVHDAVLLRQDDVVAEQALADGEHVGVGREAHERLVVREAAAQRIVLTDGGQTLTPSRGARLRVEHLVESSRQVCDFGGIQSGIDHGDARQADALGVRVGV